MMMIEQLVELPPFLQRLVVQLLLGLLLLGSLSSGGGLTTGTASWGGSGFGSILEGIELSETVVGSDGSTSQVLEGVDEHVWGGGRDDVAAGHGDAGEVVGAGCEEAEDLVVGDAEDLGVDELGGAVLSGDRPVEERGNVHLVLEWANLQTIEKGGLAGSDLVASSDDSDWVDDLNLSFHNLGGDVQGLEELGLLWVHAGGAGGDNDILGGDGADLGGGSSDLGVEDCLDFGEVTVGEDHTGVTVELVTDDVEVGSGLPATVTGHALLVVLLSLIGLSEDVCEGSLEVSVLSHDHLGVDGTELLSHDRDLLGGNVVDLDEHDLLVLKTGSLEIFPTGGLHLFLASLGHFVVCFFCRFY